MGHPTDFDGNDRLVVFVSKTVSQREYGEAYADPSDITECSGCSDPRGEIIYFADPSRFSDFESKRAYYSTNYYPRNILHEATHLAQFSNAYRSGRIPYDWRTPAFLYEGQAEIMRLESGMGATESWLRIADRFPATLKEGPTKFDDPFDDPYYQGALFAWFLHLRVGDGYSQALEDAFFSAIAEDRSVIEGAIGIPEPIALAMMYGSLWFDDQPSAEEVGLFFPSLSVSERMGEPVTTVSLLPEESIRFTRGYSGGALLEITHDTPVRVTVQSPANGPGITVLVINR
jgi:hypothetical protein